MKQDSLESKSRARLESAEKYDSCNFCGEKDNLRVIRSDRALVICICDACRTAISVGVGGEPPKGELSELIEAWNGLVMKVEFTYKGVPETNPISHVKVGRDGIVRLRKVIERLAGIELPQQENEPTVSGEAKTPDSLDYANEPMDEENWGDVRLIIDLNPPDIAAELIREMIEPKLKNVGGGSAPAVVPTEEEIKTAAKSFTALKDYQDSYILGARWAISRLSGGVVKDGQTSVD